MEKPHIFVANDDKAYLELMKMFLEEEGYKVTTLYEENKPYEEIKEAHPELVILDILIGAPDTGWVLLDKLNLDLETRHVPVIVCSADVRTLRDKADSLRKKGCLTIEKPFDIEEMLATIREALALGR